VPRFFLAAVLAIGLLFTGSVAAIWWATRGAPPDGDRPARAFAEPAAAGAGAGVVTAAPGSWASDDGDHREGDGAPDPARAVAATEPRERGASPPRPAPLSQQGSTPAARRRALVAFRRELAAGLRGLDDRLGRCSPVAPAASGAPARSGLADTSFTLTVETVDGGVRIADAAIDARGGASEAEVACALSALRGEVIPAPSAAPGSRWETTYAPAAPR
jgi:hypothetical protein